MYNFTTERYDYRQAVLDDVRNYIEEEVNLTEWRGRSDDLEEYLNDTLWCEDSVTGNASGSYWFNAWKAEECICHNLDLLEEALFEFGCPGDYIQEHGAEAADVTVRCYLLGECIAEVLEEYEGDLEEVEDLDQWVIISEDGETVQKKDLLYDWEDVKDDEALECFEHSFNDWYNNQLLLGEFIEIDEPDEEEELLDMWYSTEFECIYTLDGMYHAWQVYGCPLGAFNTWLEQQEKLGCVYSLRVNGESSYFDAEEGKVVRGETVRNLWKKHAPQKTLEKFLSEDCGGWYIPINPKELEKYEPCTFKHLEFSNGSNPYICLSYRKWKELNKKYYIKKIECTDDSYLAVDTWANIYHKKNA